VRLGIKKVHVQDQDRCYFMSKNGVLERGCFENQPQSNETIIGSNDGWTARVSIKIGRDG
jgi:hypothetical protein